MTPSQLAVSISSGHVRYALPAAGDTSQSAWNTLRGSGITAPTLRAARVPAVYPRTTRPIYGIEISGYSVSQAGGGFNAIGSGILSDSASNVHAFRDALQASVDEAKTAFGVETITPMLWHITKYHDTSSSPTFFDNRYFSCICPSRVTAAYIDSLESWFQDLRDDGDIPGLYFSVPQVEPDTSSLTRDGAWLRHPDDDSGSSWGILKTALQWCQSRGAIEVGLDLFNDIRAYRSYPAYSGGSGWADAPNADWNGTDAAGVGTYEPAVPRDEDFDLWLETQLIEDTDINQMRFVLEPFTPLGRSRFPQLEVVEAPDGSGDRYNSSTLPDLAAMRSINPGAEVIGLLHDTPEGWGTSGEDWDSSLAELRSKGYRPASHYTAMLDAEKVSSLT